MSECPGVVRKGGHTHTGHLWATASVSINIYHQHILSYIWIASLFQTHETISQTLPIKSHYHGSFLGNYPIFQIQKWNHRGKRYSKQELKVIRKISLLTYYFSQVFVPFLISLKRLKISTHTEEPLNQVTRPLNLLCEKKIEIYHINL